MAKHSTFLLWFMLPKFRRLTRMGWEVSAVYGADEFTKEIQETGAKCHPVRSLGSLNPFRAAWAFVRLFWIFTRGNYDLIVTHTPIASFIARIAAKAASAPVVLYTAHGLPCMSGMPRWRWRFYYFLEKLASMFADGLLCVNREDYELALRCRLARSKKNIFYRSSSLGVNTERFRKLRGPERAEALKELGIDREVKTVGFLGRVIEAKGVLDRRI